MAVLEPLELLTKNFRATYASERARVQRSLDTVVLLRFSGATLFRNGEIVETVRVLPSEYHNLRYAAHVPFMLYLKLTPLSGQSFDEPTRDWLREAVSQIQGAQRSIDGSELRHVQLVRQHRIFSDAIGFIENALAVGEINMDHLRRYARTASIDVEHNMREAGAAQVDGLHRQLLKWRQELGEAAWRKVRFIVRGPQQPRGGHASVLYLSALLKDSGDGRGYQGESQRLVYREDTSLPGNAQSAHPWEADLQLLAAVRMDASASDALFSDPDRLAVDIAADGARARIRELDLSTLQQIDP